MIDKIVTLCNSILLHRSKLSFDEKITYRPQILDYNVSFQLSYKGVVRIKNDTHDTCTDIFWTRHGYMFTIYPCYISEKSSTICLRDTIYRIEHCDGGMRLVVKEGSNDNVVHSNITEDDLFALGVIYDPDVINMLYTLYNKLSNSIIVYYELINEQMLDELNEKYNEVLNAI